MVNAWIVSQAGLKVDRIEFVTQPCCVDSSNISIWYHLSGSKPPKVRLKILAGFNATVDVTDEQANAWMATPSDIVATAQTTGAVGTAYDLAIIYEP